MSKQLLPLYEHVLIGFSIETARDGLWDVVLVPDLLDVAVVVHGHGKRVALSGKGVGW